MSSTFHGIIILKPGGRAAIAYRYFLCGWGQDQCAFLPEAQLRNLSRKRIVLRMSGFMTCVPICRALVNDHHLKAFEKIYGKKSDDYEKVVYSIEFDHLEYIHN